jgi:sec-independent protein translocase protein TatB
MFDLFSWSHIIILLTVALVVVGPKDLPRLMNIMGRWAGKARDMANEFKKSFEDMARQSELDELRAEVEKLRTQDPIAEFGNDVERALNPTDFETGSESETSKPESDETPPPRSGEYQISETPAAEPQAPNSENTETVTPPPANRQAAQS